MDLSKLGHFQRGRQVQKDLKWKEGSLIEEPEPANSKSHRDLLKPAQSKGFSLTASLANQLERQMTKKGAASLYRANGGGAASTNYETNGSCDGGNMFSPSMAHLGFTPSTQKEGFASSALGATKSTPKAGATMTYQDQWEQEKMKEEGNAPKQPSAFDITKPLRKGTVMTAEQQVERTIKQGRLRNMKTSKLLHEVGDQPQVREAPTLPKPIMHKIEEEKPQEYNFQSKNKIVVDCTEHNSKQLTMQVMTMMKNNLHNHYLLIAIGRANVHSAEEVCRMLHKLIVVSDINAFKKDNESHLIVKFERCQDFKDRLAKKKRQVTKKRTQR